MCSSILIDSKDTEKDFFALIILLESLEKLRGEGVANRVTEMCRDVASSSTKVSSRFLTANDVPLLFKNASYTTFLCY